MVAKQAPNQYGVGFLAASDFLRNGSWQQFDLEIANIAPAGTVTAENGKPIDRPVLYFKGATKGFAPSKTTQKLIKCQVGVDVAGKDAGKAIGQKLCLYPVVGDWFKIKNLAGIRVRIDPNKPRPMIQVKDMGRDITGTKICLESIESIKG